MCSLLLFVVVLFFELTPVVVHPWYVAILITAALGSTRFSCRYVPEEGVIHTGLSFQFATIVFCPTLLRICIIIVSGFFLIFGCDILLCLQVNLPYGHTHKVKDKEQLEKNIDAYPYNQSSIFFLYNFFNKERKNRGNDNKEQVEKYIGLCFDNINPEQTNKQQQQQQQKQTNKQTQPANRSCVDPSNGALLCPEIEGRLVGAGGSCASTTVFSASCELGARPPPFSLSYTTFHFFFASLSPLTCSFFLVFAVGELFLKSNLVSACVPSLHFFVSLLSLSHSISNYDDPIIIIIIIISQTTIYLSVVPLFRRRIPIDRRYDIIHLASLQPTTHCFRSHYIYNR
eukprot:gene11630-8018_t